MPKRLTFRVLDNFGVVRLHDGNARVRGTEVDADDAVEQDKKKCEIDISNKFAEKPRADSDPDS